MTDIDVLLCYRGRFRDQVERLDRLLAAHGLAVTFDAEILQPGVEYGDAEIEWISLGLDEGNDGDTSWRGPISAAIERSNLVVFLVDTQDASINVLNEIAWTSHSDKPLFVVFNTAGDGHSAEWEALQVSMIQIMYSLATGDPEVPAFGFHFVTHESDEGLEQRLTILVNRIVSYIEQVAAGGVGTVRMDDEVTLSDVENTPLARARRHLHAVQQRIASAHRVEAPLVEGDPLQNALEFAHRRERDGVVRGGRIHPRESPFSYVESSERERYRRTEALLQAIRPGPFEIPPFIEMLARELVSIQMVLDAPMERAVLVGTGIVTPSDVAADVIIDRDYAILLVDASLMDYVYQMLKATVMSWKILSPPDVSPVAMSSAVDDTREVIASSPELVSGFARAVGRMLREGRPGSTTPGPPPRAYHLPLSMLGVFQKRFTVAVALARMAARDMILENAARRSVEPPSMPSQEWVFASDLLAARWVFDSAAELDDVDPTTAFHGISIALASYHLVESLVAGFRPPELTPASVRVQHIAAFFTEYLVERGMSRDAADERRESHRGVVAALDLLRGAALESGALDLEGLDVAPRWRRHIRGGG